MASVRLASLTLEGFKSFAGRVELSFPGAIIAIVGPNGTGKSNIADAIAWVLGEQSARLLRSQSMADVIFAGSPRRAPLGGASVALYLTAGDGRWAGTDGRLEISRRVLRDGTSDYRIGGRRVRLKDVLDHLMDAGLGTRAYAIIEQGRIGQVLSVRATERRLLFEEAAGITKFRARRHEAELKLAETKANLLRLADVASEVRRNLEAARRQARRAEKHRELRTRLAAVRGTLFAGRRAVALHLVDARQEARTAAHLIDAQAAAALGGHEAALASQRRELDASIEQVAAARQEEADANARAQRREAEEAAARQRHAEALARREAAAAEGERLAAEIRAHERQGAALEGAATAARHHGRVGRDGRRPGPGPRPEPPRRPPGSPPVGPRRLAASSWPRPPPPTRPATGATASGSSWSRWATSAPAWRASSSVCARASPRPRRAPSRPPPRAAALAAATAEDERTRGELRSRLEAATTRASELAAARDQAGHERWQAHHERLGVQRTLQAARALPQVLARAVPTEKVLGTVSDFLDPDPSQAALLDRAWGDLLLLPVVADETSVRELLARRLKGEGRIEVAVANRSLPPRTSPLLEAAGARPEDLGWLGAALPRAAVAETVEEGERLAAADPDLVVLLPGGARRRGTRVELPAGQAVAPGVLELRQRERALAAIEVRDRHRGAPRRGPGRRPGAAC